MHGISLRRGIECAIVLAIIVLATQASETARANIRLVVPEESASGPFYARLERGLVHQTEEWVAIAFYRNPGCVPAGFNLLNLFDFGNIPAIFACPLTVHGFEIWANGPQSDPAPLQSKLRGNGAVPIWFVSVADFNQALPGITKAELEGMPSLMQGSASFFDETLHPTGGAQQSILKIVAYGLLPDGRSFQYQATEAAGEMRGVRIEFR
jgi:hypothetical protein